jgi:hypothetical protein
MFSGLGQPGLSPALLLVVSIIQFRHCVDLLRVVTKRRLYQLHDGTEATRGADTRRLSR